MISGWFYGLASAKQSASGDAAIAGTDRARVEQSIRGYAGVDEQTAALVTLVGYPTRMDPTRLQRVPDLMNAFGVLKGHMDVRSMILPSVMTGQS